MEQELFTTIQITSFAPALFLFVWKVLIPFTNSIVARMNKVDLSSAGRITKLETNDLVHIQAQLDKIEDKMDSFQKQIGTLEGRVLVLETFMKR